MNFPFRLQADRDFDIVGFGTNAVDFLIRVPEYPAFDSKVELTDYVQAAGGEIATSMVGLQRLGLRTCYVGRFGDDAAGDFGLQSLVDEGVDVSFAGRVKGAYTQIAFIVIDVRSGERTVIWKRDPKLAFAAGDVPHGLMARTSVLHLTPHDTRASIALAADARHAGTITSIDIDHVFDGIDELLPLMDVMITSADLPSRLFGIEEKRPALIALQEKYGSPIVGITLGEEGSLLLCRGQFIETSGFAVPGGCKDTTGAGDSFRAGLLYGLIRGESVEESARIANAVAALKCRAIGARTSLPTLEEVRKLLGDR